MKNDGQDIIHPIALGRLVGDARRACSLTQQELADKAGIGYSTLTKIERGIIKNPSVFTIHRIAQITKTTIESLLTPLDTKPAQKSQRVSKTGVRFLYCGLEGVLVVALEAACLDLAQKAGVSVTRTEQLFWAHYEDFCRGEIDLDNFNQHLARGLNLKTVDWPKVYAANVKPIIAIQELLKWAVRHYPVGLLVNTDQTVVKELISTNKLPDLDYSQLIFSAQTKATKPQVDIYKAASQAAGVKPDSILLIDQPEVNLRPAQDMGWQTAFFSQTTIVASYREITDKLEF